MAYKDKTNSQSQQGNNPAAKSADYDTKQKSAEKKYAPCKNSNPT